MYFAAAIDIHHSEGGVALSMGEGGVFHGGGTLVLTWLMAGRGWGGIHGGGDGS